MPTKKKNSEQKEPVFAFRMPPEMIAALDALVDRAGSPATRTDVLHMFVQAGIDANGVTEEELRAQELKKTDRRKCAQDALSVLVFPGKPPSKASKSPRKRAREQRVLRNSGVGSQSSIVIPECDNRTVETRAAA